MSFSFKIHFLCFRAENNLSCFGFIVSTSTVCGLQLSRKEYSVWQWLTYCKPFVRSAATFAYCYTWQYHVHFVYSGKADHCMYHRFRQSYYHATDIFRMFWVVADLLSCVSEAIQIDLPLNQELVLFLLSTPDPHHKTRHGSVQKVWEHAKIQAPPSWVLHTNK